MSNRELDAEVGLRIMGFKPPRDGFQNNYPPYSSDIAAAFLVVEKMRERHFIWQGGHVIPEKAENGMTMYAEFGYAPNGLTRTFTELASTLPEAICRAALAAISS